jgi:hypothetical protein
LTYPAPSAIGTGASKDYTPVISCAVVSKYCKQAEASRAISPNWLALWSVLTKQKAVNFGGVEVQILKTSCSSFKNNNALHNEFEGNLLKLHVTEESK